MVDWNLHLVKMLASYRLIAFYIYHTLLSRASIDVYPSLRWFFLTQSKTPYLMGAHTLYAAVKVHNMTHGSQFWLKSFVLTVFAAFGGSTLAALLCAQPAPLFTNASDTMLAYAAVSWYVVNHIAPLRAMLQWRPVAAVLSFYAMAAKTRTIFAFIDAYHRQFPAAMSGAVLLGGLAGSGGLLFLSLERLMQEGRSARSELSAPGWGFKSAYIAAASYYVATDPSKILRAMSLPLAYALKSRDAKFYISLLLCMHSAVETLVGRHVNPVYLLEQAFFALTRVQKHAEPLHVERTSEKAPKSSWKPNAASKAGVASASGLRKRRGPK